MATYFELLTAYENSDLNRRVRVAVLIAAEKIRTESPATPNNANRVLWAKETFRDPSTAAQRMLPVVIAKAQVDTPAVTLGQITGASDATVQTSVDAAVNVFATGA
jgi:hypothetical protein